MITATLATLILSLVYIKGRLDGRAAYCKRIAVLLDTLFHNVKVVRQ